MTTTTTMICAVCHRALDHYTGRGWEHTAYDLLHGDGHPAIPVEPSGVVQPSYRCDFCQVDVTEAWVVRAREFSLLGANFSDDWLADPICAELIQRGDWDALTERATVSYAQRHGQIDDLLRQFIRMLHDAVRRNLISGPMPMEAP